MKKNHLISLLMLGVIILATPINAIANIYNVTSYFHTGDPDYTNAINRAITAAIADQTGGSVYFPSGTYAVSSAISYQSLSKNIAFTGDGPTSSIITANTSGANLFDLAFTDILYHVSFRDLGLQANASSCGKAIKVAVSSSSPTYPFNDMYPGLTVDNVNITGSSSYYFSEGINLSGVNDSQINACTITGCTSSATGSGINIPVDSVNSRITNSTISNWFFGVQFSGSGYDNAQQGTMIYNCTFNPIFYGICTQTQATTSATAGYGPVLIYVKSCTFYPAGGGGRAFYMTIGSFNFFIDNNILLPAVANSGAGGGLLLFGTILSHVNGNGIFSASSGTPTGFYGIALCSDSGSIYYNPYYANMVLGNDVGNVFSSGGCGIWLQTPADNSSPYPYSITSAIGNYIYGSGTVLDQGTDDTIH